MSKSTTPFETNQQVWVKPDARCNLQSRGQYTVIEQMLDNDGWHVKVGDGGGEYYSADTFQSWEPAKNDAEHERMVPRG